MFIAITPYQVLTEIDLNHYIEISESIDLLLLRVPMDHESLCISVDYLIHHGFPKDKLMVHSDITLLKKYDLTFIHFRENDEHAFSFKQSHPHISVSMSTHSSESIQRAQKHGLDFVCFGHVFETASKDGKRPRSNEEIKRAVAHHIPIYAIGGIHVHTIKHLPPGFKGICAISFFRKANIQEIKSLRKVWQAYV
ncbi:thiamine phosphate synthase [Mammaliicoccus sp. Dog046]|uniref:thiamine phosphate synthase n=1 Tax=Mammaliicoccus sp. Dog046 TaxID=3034233 RepID=UPI002B25A637|nr:thiamine phosphate synthase [Mammaliicoccus sp. Dog046]WQK85776.1 thiamine phosphate synthase [Mammaliicoccus sp. Dog046]